MSDGLLDEVSWDEGPSPLDGLDNTPVPDEGEWSPETATGYGEWTPGQPAAPAAPAYYPEQQPQYQQPAWQPPYQEPPPADPQLSETERKFAKYGFYRLLITTRFFKNDGDPLAEEVEQELAAFVRGRMASLLGAEGEEPIAGLSQDEIRALKVVAASVMRQTGGRPPATPPRAKSLGPARMAPVAAQPPQAPPQAPRRPPAPPQRPPQAPPPRAPQQPQLRAPTTPPARQQQARPGVPPGPKGGVPPHEAIVMEGGKKFKVIHRETYPAEYGPAAEQILLQLPVGMHTKLPKVGVQILRRGPEEFVKIVRVDQTTQRGRGGVPFPRNMAAATRALAEESIENVRLAPGVQSAITHGMR